MDGLLLRIFVYGWCRGNERHEAIIGTWIDLLRRGSPVSERHVAAASGQPSATVHKVLTAFRQDVRRAQLEEAELGTPIEWWLELPASHAGPTKDHPC